MMPFSMASFLVVWLFLGSYLDNQGKKHNVQVIFIMYILGGVGKKNQQCIAHSVSK